MAVVNQPQPGTIGMVPLGVTPGLDSLVNMDTIFVKQKKEFAEMATGCETKNKYNVFNAQQQKMFYCFEESEECNRICCGPNRGFILHLQDNDQREILTLVREFKHCAGGCGACADGCCAYPIEIYDAQKNHLGMMRHTKFHCSGRWGIFDTADNQLYAIHGGECCGDESQCCTKQDVIMPIFSCSDGACVGNFAKQWGGYATEMLTDATNLKLTFPMDMHISHKILLFAGMFMIDMTAFEG